MKGSLSGANGGGGQRVGTGTVSAWAGSQMAWEAAPGVPCTNRESGSGALGKSGCLRGLSFLPWKMGAVSLPPAVLEGQRALHAAVVACCLSWAPRAGAGPHHTRPVTSRGPASALTAGATHEQCRGLLPDSSLSLVFSTSPFRKKENAEMLRAETLTGSLKAPPGGS